MCDITEYGYGKIGKRLDCRPKILSKVWVHQWPSMGWVRNRIGIYIYIKHRIKSKS